MMFSTIAMFNLDYNGCDAKYNRHHVYFYVYDYQSKFILHMKKDKQFLYLTTTGHKSGNQHEIEIWFVTHEGNYYLFAERRENAHWVQNIRHQPHIQFWANGQDYGGKGRVIDDVKEPQLVKAVSALMNEKYNWNNGLIVELSPE